MLVGASNRTERRWPYSRRCRDLAPECSALISAEPFRERPPAVAERAGECQHDGARCGRAV